MMTKQHFDPYARHYASLSVKDLLDGREACHLQLSHSSNVFATAIGLYRIRTTDVNSKRYTPASEAVKQRGKLGPLTLENSITKPWSWPCILVFVREWKSPGDLHGSDGQPIPPFIFLADGRVIPVCTVLATLFEGSPTKPPNPLAFTSNIIGGGYPVVTEVQGAEHAGSIACLVSDGNRYFALTNQHVAGGPGREIYTIVGGRRSRIGVASESAIRSLPFTRVYDGFPGTGLKSNLDVGLIEIEDLAQWTSQIFGLGVLGPAIDFDSVTVTLDWIGVPVIAHGGASGRLEGEVKALFYRYRTVNGTDYVSDFLIGGRGKSALLTAPGDSGTLWCVDPLAGCETVDDRARKTTGQKANALPERYRPLAVEWGGQKLTGPDGDRYTQFALASSVGAACAALDVEIIADLNTEHTQYWGRSGHYKIAQLAIEQTKSPDLKKFLTANLTQLTYDAAAIQAHDIAGDATRFVPLADVPDIVWKTSINRGGKAARAQENWNHYTDIDQPGRDGKTLSDLCGEPPVIDLAQWIEFYRTAPVPHASRSRINNMGSLPFRVWRIFDEMVGYRQAAAADAAANFLCAAGIISHYVGDACQPLHSSMHSDGLDGASTGVHGAYEDKMIDAHAEELRQRLDSFSAKTLGAPLAPVASGYEAAQASIELMRRVHAILPPTAICEAYNKLGGGQGSAVINGLWDELGDATVKCIAEGARTLAVLWESAWRSARGKAFSGAVPQAKLQSIYENKSFLPSLHLANLKPEDYPVPHRKPSSPKPPGEKKAVKKPIARRAHA